MLIFKSISSVDWDNIVSGGLHSKMGERIHEQPATRLVQQADHSSERRRSGQQSQRLQHCRFRWRCYFGFHYTWRLFLRPRYSWLRRRLLPSQVHACNSESGFTSFYPNKTTLQSFKMTFFNCALKSRILECTFALLCTFDCLLRQSIPIFKNIKITQCQILCDNIASLLCLQYVIFLVVLLLVEVTFIILIFAVRSEVSAKHHN